MEKSNKIIIAAAGSGKTTLLVNEALKKQEGRILITTYTQTNEEEIRRKFIEKNQCIPGNITIQPWYSFLLKHGARPYQGCKFNEDIRGLFLVNGQSKKYTKESDVKKYYFTDENKIYSDKLSKFVVECNKQSSGAVIDRLERIYTDIFIDEVQDLAGDDLDFLDLLFKCRSNILLVCDPRQATYSTTDSRKHKKFKGAAIVDFFKKKLNIVDIDEDSLIINHRGCSAICNLSNRLYPQFKETESERMDETGHDGIFFIENRDIEYYLSLYKPMQLRWDAKVKVSESCPVLTFGASKGRAFERVLIYPNKKFIAWLKNNNSKLPPTSRSKFYVAITRARFSVAILCDEGLEIEGIKKFSASEP